MEANDKFRREGSDANDHNIQVYRRGEGMLKGNPYQIGSPEWTAWKNGYAHRDIENDGHRFHRVF